MSPAAEVQAVAAEPRPFTARLFDVLGVCNTCRGSVAVEASSLSGLGRSTLTLSLPARAIPVALLDAIRDGHSLRVRPVTRGSGNAPLDLGAAFVLWRPVPRFDATTGWRYRVPEEEQATIRTVLSTFPRPPALLIDAGPEVVGFWPLVAPLAVDQDPARAIALLSGLAVRLGADVQAAQGMLELTLPLAGPVRNWNVTNPDAVELLDVDPARRYPVEDLEAAISQSAPPARRTGAKP